LHSIDDWNRLVLVAEAHGLAPLVYSHLATSGLPVPLNALRSLRGLYIRHRKAARIRTRVLEQILSEFDDAEVECLVLKGAALAHLIYPDVALRPMGDLDLLVKGDQLSM